MFTLDKSKQAFNEAKAYMPGGVNSPVRSYRSVVPNRRSSALLPATASMILTAMNTLTMYYPGGL